jgi:EAL domain-containing protein (putative c-di-GMP-specific phosphodiesterase class I)
MSVNFSARQFAHDDLYLKVRGVLDDTKIAPGSLKLDITGSTMMARSETVAALFVELRALQVDIHIDDFGTGYSSLSCLRELPVNAVKIDCSLIAGMLESRERAEMVRAIVSIAHTLRLTAIAEGVESIDEVRLLRELSCEYAQGFLFSRPLTAAAATDLVGSIVSRELPIPLTDPSSPGRRKIDVVKGTHRTSGADAAGTPVRQRHSK